MRNKNRFGKYVVATKDDGTFQVNKIGNGRTIDSQHARLDICQNCLNALAFDGFSFALPKTARRQLVTDFAIVRFLKNIQSLYTWCAPPTTHIVRQ